MHHVLGEVAPSSLDRLHNLGPLTLLFSGITLYVNPTEESHYIALPECYPAEAFRQVLRHVDLLGLVEMDDCDPEFLDDGRTLVWLEEAA